MISRFIGLARLFAPISRESRTKGRQSLFVPPNDSSLWLIALAISLAIAMLGIALPVAFLHSTSYNG